MGISKDNSTFTCDKCGRPVYAGGIRTFYNGSEVDCYQAECLHCGYTTTLSMYKLKKFQKEKSAGVKIVTGGGGQPCYSGS